MAKFDFYLSNAAANSGANGRTREHARMACLAYGMQRLGHDVHIVSVWNEFQRNPLWKFFQTLHGRPRNEALTVHPAEAMDAGNKHCDVGIKCCLGNHDKDELWLKRCQLYVARDVMPGLSGNERLLMVPHLVHYGVMMQLAEDGLFQAYLDDDVEAIREFYDAPKTDKIGFAGEDVAGRREFAEKLQAELGDVCDFRFDERMPPGEYLRWMCSLRAALILPGEREATYRFAEAVMLGVLTIIKEQAQPIEPPACVANSIALWDWDDAPRISRRFDFAEEMLFEADEFYREYWSPTGQAGLAISKLGVTDGEV